MVIEALTNALRVDGEKLLGAEEIAALTDGVVKLEPLVAGEDTAAINEGIELIGRASEEFAGLRMDASVREALSGHQIEELEEG